MDRAQSDRLARIATHATDLVDAAEHMPGGDSERNLLAVCTAALCDALARGRS